jgi:dTDP-4-dehydrorhamnose reductase
MRIAVTGPRGRLASWLIAHHGCLPLECDITDYDATRIEIQRVEPDIIINAAAYTNVDGAEAERDEAILINLRGAGNVRMAFGGYLVHLSTTYVFDGQSSLPYKEDAFQNPLNHYGFTKFGGEAAVLPELEENGLIVRLISLYGCSEKQDFVQSVLWHLRAGKSLSLPDTLVSNPTYIPHLCEGLMAAIDKRITGVLNIGGVTIVSRYDWAKEIAKVFRLNKRLVVKKTFATEVAVRPPNHSMDLSKAESLGIPLYTLRSGLKDLRKCLGKRSTSPL